MLKSLYFFTICILLFLSSCGTYKKSVMLETKNPIVDSSQITPKLVNGHYPILINDKIELKVYSNHGELLIDPNMQFKQEFIGREIKQNTISTNAFFLVEEDSSVYLPMIGPTKVVGLTKNQLDSLLRVKYNTFYENPFVLTKVVSRKVYIFGAVAGQEVYLEDENMNVLEVLALSGYEGLTAKTDNIKVVRGDINNPSIAILDLSTAEGMTKAQMIVFPNDVIYIQPRRKTAAETLRDISVAASVLTSILTLFLVITQ